MDSMENIQQNRVAITQHNYTSFENILDSAKWVLFAKVLRYRIIIQL
jgi:hypothetical protein